MGQRVQGVRYAEVERESNETRVRVVLDIDGGTKRNISTGIGFFDHMLDQFAFHGNFDLGLQAEGDLEIDDHHTVEDVAIVLGKAFKEAMSANDPIRRYFSISVPMDETLVLCAIDVSGRGILGWNVPFTRERVGGLATECVPEFFRAFTAHSGITIHFQKLAGTNDHHGIEAVFKSFGLCLRDALVRIERKGPSSTKGRID